MRPTESDQVAAALLGDDRNEFTDSPDPRLELRRRVRARVAKAPTRSIEWSPWRKSARAAYTSAWPRWKPLWSGELSARAISRSPGSVSALRRSAPHRGSG